MPLFFIQVYQSPVTIPSESLFTPIKSILNILTEYDKIQCSDERISYEILYELQKKASDLISKNAGPIIKSRSSTMSSYSNTELYKSLLSKLNIHKENFNTLFQEASSYILIAADILKKGYEYNNYFMIL
jgi:hypothetical protein